MNFMRLLRRQPPVEVQPAPAPPVAGQLMRTVEQVRPAQSLAKAIHLIRQLQVPALPVTDGGMLVAWLREEHVAAQVFAHDSPGESVPVSEAMEPVPLVVAPGVPLEDLVSLFQATGLAAVPVVSSAGACLGLLLRADVLAAQAGCLAPPRIGGMATPLGVYLTTGTVSGGPGGLGLLLSGMTLAFIFWAAQVIVLLSAFGLFHLTRQPFWLQLARMVREEPTTLPPLFEAALFLATTFLLFAVFLLLLRIMPRMAGFHGAEHQTVNALEAGEPLTPEAVGRMPRVHPRCGTNLWGIMALSYLGVVLLAMALSTQYGRQNIPTVAMLALWLVLLVVLGWRRVGSWLQQHFTTRTATPAELESGIRAGREVLSRHHAQPHPPTFIQRLWGMGLLQVAIGILVMGSLLQWLEAPLDKLCLFLVK